MSVTLHSGEVTFGITLATVEPVWMISRSLSNIMWKGKTLQKVAAPTFGSANKTSVKENKQKVKNIFKKLPNLRCMSVSEDLL